MAHLPPPFRAFTTFGNLKVSLFTARYKHKTSRNRLILRIENDTMTMRMVLTMEEAAQLALGITDWIGENKR